MAGSLSDSGENLVLDHITGVTSMTFAQKYVALFTTAPTDSTGGTEVTGGSYARVQATFSAASGGATSNSSAVTFTTATGSWGTVVAIGLMTASTAGTLIAWADLAANKTVSSGDTFSIPIGDLDFTLT